MDIGVITATAPSATFVQSHVPPTPTSMTATSTGASANTAKAIAVNPPKKDSEGGGEGPGAERPPAPANPPRDRGQVRAGEQAGSQPAGPQQCLGHPGGG